jgi:hypothetical protein
LEYLSNYFGILFIHREPFVIDLVSKWWSTYRLFAILESIDLAILHPFLDLLMFSRRKDGLDTVYIMLADSSAKLYSPLGVITLTP